MNLDDPIFLVIGSAVMFAALYALSLVPFEKLMGAETEGVVLSMERDSGRIISRIEYTDFQNKKRVLETLA